jgi:dihydrofolate reductase
MRAEFSEERAGQEPMSDVPRVCIVAAVARNRAIGRGNGMPWHLPEDLRRFKRLTSGYPVVMGRKTFESIIATTGRPLPSRENIVITRSTEWSFPGCLIAHSFGAALATAKNAQNVFVIGGAEIYALALPVARRLYLTEIDREFDGDTFFPEFDRSRWREIFRDSRRLGGGEDFEYAFVEYERDD